MDFNLSKFGIVVCMNTHVLFCCIVMLEISFWCTDPLPKEVSGREQKSS
jgi:hypothetical protein